MLHEIMMFIKSGRKFVHVKHNEIFDSFPIIMIKNNYEIMFPNLSSY